MEAESSSMVAERKQHFSKRDARRYKPFLREQFSVNIKPKVLKKLLNADGKIPNIIKESLFLQYGRNNSRFRYLDEGYDHSDQYFTSLFLNTPYARENDGNGMKVMHRDTFMERVEKLRELDGNIKIADEGDSLTISYDGKVSDMLDDVNYIEDPVKLDTSCLAGNGSKKISRTYIPGKGYRINGD